MKHSIYAATAALILLVSCSAPFKKTDHGMEYKIITSGKGEVAKPGYFLEFSFDRSYKNNGKDTVLYTSADFANQIIPLDSTQVPPVYYKIFTQVRMGDSIILKQLSDSAMGQQADPSSFMKKGGYVIAHFKILNVYTKRESADSAFNVQMALAKSRDSIRSIAQLKKDDKIIADYLKAKNIQAVKAPAGTYVQVINPGEGDPVDTSKVLKVMYTGKSLADGQVFDSNTDPSRGHTDPLPVYMGAAPGTPGSVIPGWTDGLSLLKKGAKAVLYIPSSLAYGKQGSRGAIKPDANLVFDVEVIDVVTLAQHNAEMQAMRKEMEAEQKKRVDSLQKANKLSPVDTDKRK